MIQFVKFILSDFWVFIGFIIILSLIIKTILYFVLIIIKSKIVKKHGYPPSNFNLDKYLLDDDNDDINDEKS